MIGRENSCHHLNQSNATLKLIPTWSLVFSRVLSRLPVFTLSSHWLTMMSTFALIGLLVYRHSIQTSLTVKLFILLTRVYIQVFSLKTNPFTLYSDITSSRRSCVSCTASHSFRFVRAAFFVNIVSFK